MIEKLTLIENVLLNLKPESVEYSTGFVQILIPSFESNRTNLEAVAWKQFTRSWKEPWKNVPAGIAMKYTMISRSLPFNRIYLKKMNMTILLTKCKSRCDKLKKKLNIAVICNKASNFFWFWQGRIWFILSYHLIWFLNLLPQAFFFSLFLYILDCQAWLLSLFHSNLTCHLPKEQSRRKEVKRKYVNG